MIGCSWGIHDDGDPGQTEEGTKNVPPVGPEAINEHPPGQRASNEDPASFSWRNCNSRHRRSHQGLGSSVEAESADQHLQLVRDLGQLGHRLLRLQHRLRGTAGNIRHRGDVLGDLR